MVKWLLSLPKNILVVLILGGAIVFIIANDPPHDICRTQIDNFNSRQKGLIYLDPAIKNRKKPLIPTLVDTCKKYNTPGSCYGLFSKIKVFIRSFELVSASCSKSFSSLSKVKQTLFNVYQLMIRLAWADEPPLEYQDKRSWLSEVDLSLFCLIKQQIISLYGAEALLNLERKTFKILPGSESLSENQMRDLAIVSENCALFPPL